MTFRQHATSVVDHGIRIGLISLIAVPLWLALWFAACDSDDSLCRSVAFPGFAFLAPAYVVIKLWDGFGLSNEFPLGLFLWLLVLFSVPAFWGTVSYGGVYLYRRLRDHPRPEPSDAAISEGFREQAAYRHITKLRGE